MVNVKKNSIAIVIVIVIHYISCYSSLNFILYNLHVFQMTKWNLTQITKFAVIDIVCEPLVSATMLNKL